LKSLFTYILFLFCGLKAVLAQDTIKPLQIISAPDSIIIPNPEPVKYPDKKKIWIVGGSQVALWTGSFIALNQAWYADYPKQDFHFFNDWKEWQQMDKSGHA
jgi:hypothetical protein